MQYRILSRYQYRQKRGASEPIAWSPWAPLMFEEERESLQEAKERVKALKERTKGIDRATKLKHEYTIIEAEE